jgi:predicted dehydrogenase
MRFALLGTHPDGLEMACALAATGRHELAAYTSQSIPPAVLNRWGPKAEAVGDLEEVLADPNIEAVIVAGTPANRPAQLRRSLQSERHVLCVHPPDRTPDIAYEAAMIQADTGRVLFPLLPDALHPALRRLVELLDLPDGPIGAPRLVVIEDASAGEFLLEPQEIYVKWALPGWDRLRVLGGEIAVVSALAPQEDLEPGQPLLLSGVFERGHLFEVSLLPAGPQPRWRATVTGERDRAELLFPVGWQGPAFLTWRDRPGESHEEYFPTWDPWPPLVLAFEAALGGKQARNGERATHITEHSVLSTQFASDPQPGPPSSLLPSWQDVIRALELDDAARRSVAKRRAGTLEYPEPSEETGFKSTMTLLGCGMLWVILLLLLLSFWKPWLGWFIVPVLVVFLLLQGLRWFARRSPD